MDLLTPLREHFGHQAFRSGQENVIRALLTGQSALALFPTGAGKSLCYQLPALLLQGTALIISPLIALMRDQVEALVRRNIAAARLDSTLSTEEAQQVLQDFVSGRLKLLYVAPERLAQESFIERVKRTRISLLAIDEAHCISEWGHNFRPDYLRLARLSEELKLHPVLTLTATATPSAAQDIIREFHIDQTQFVQTSFHRPNLHLRITPISADRRLAELTKRLQSAKVRPAVVYVTLQQTAEDVAGHLARSGLRAKPYHAGLPDELRDQIQDEFMTGQIDIVVATIAFGMGIDKSDIRGVFHFNLPKSIENYQQEIGRAGRDGKPALCEMLACGDDRYALENFTYGDTPSPTAVRSLVDHMLSQGPEFSVSKYDISQATDIRPLVVGTILAYLETTGLIRPTGAFHESYGIEFLRPQPKILAGHTPERQQFLLQLFAAGTMGRSVLTINLTDAAESLGQPRDRLVNAITWLEEGGDIKLRLKGVRHGFRLTEEGKNADLAIVARDLVESFARREIRDIARLDRVEALATEPHCLTRHLLDYFGESFSPPCGHCHHCRPAHKPPAQPVPLPRRAIPDLTDDDILAIQKLWTERHAALRSARQMARFFCGITSPATTKAKLTRHDDFGRLQLLPFGKIMQYLESLGVR